MRPLLRASLLGLALLLASSWPNSGPSTPSAATAQAITGGRVLASARGQVAWLDFVAPRPTPLTQLVRPAYPADVAAVPGVTFAVASILSTYPSGTAAVGGDLVRVDLQSGPTQTLVARRSETESLDLPAIWPDGSGILYQRSNLAAMVPMPGQAQPQYRSAIEQVAPDGSEAIVLLDDARYPGPAPDGVHFAFVRSADRGSAIFVHSVADGLDQELVGPGQFLALAYPRFSPDGQHVAFVAISLLAPIGGSGDLLATLGLRTPRVMAHGFPWEVWLVNSDGTNLRQVPDVLDDDPSAAWSPDGGQLLIYGGWGSFVVDAATGSSTSLPYVAGYGSVAWLPD